MDKVKELRKAWYDIMMEVYDLDRDLWRRVCFIVLDLQDLYDRKEKYEKEKSLLDEVNEIIERSEKIEKENEKGER